MTYKSISSVIRGILTESHKIPDINQFSEEAPAEIVNVHPETTEAPVEPTAADIVAAKYFRRPHVQKQEIQRKIIDNA